MNTHPVMPPLKYPLLLIVIRISKYRERLALLSDWYERNTLGENLRGFFHNIDIRKAHRNQTNIPKETVPAALPAEQKNTSSTPHSLKNSRPSVYIKAMDSVLRRQLTYRKDETFEQWLRKKGFDVTDHLQSADIVILKKDKEVYFPRFRHAKKFIISVDPKYSLLRKKNYRVHDKPLLVANIWVNSLLTNNYFYYRSTGMPMRRFSLLPARFADIKHKWNKLKKVLVCKKLHPFWDYPECLDDLRTKLSVYGYALGVTDILGQFWPSFITAERPEPGLQKYPGKIELLAQKYLFSLCLENSNAPYYVTEKPWQALASRTLPIYYSNNTLYETFPKDYIIDYRNFNDKAALYQFIMDMSPGEYIDRLNVGVEFANQHEKHFAQAIQWADDAKQHIYDDLMSLVEMS